MNNCLCKASGELGIALSGGGARGIAQIGVLKVLDRERVPVSYVTGTSAGAVIGAVYVTSEDAAEAEQRVLEHLNGKGIGFNAETFAGLDPSVSTNASSMLNTARGVWRVFRPGGSLIGGEAMRDSLRCLLGETTFGDTNRPFATTALDLISGRRMIVAAGSLVDAVYASAAIPGLFEPLETSTCMLVDGGWAEPVPVDACHHLGAIHIIAVDVPSKDDFDPDASGVTSVLRADELARDLLEEEHLRKADFVVRLNTAVRHFADFSDPESLIAAGERAAEASLQDIIFVLERHRSLFLQVPETTDPRLS